MTAGVTSGTFRVAVISPTKGSSDLAIGVPANGGTSYQLPWTVMLASAADWTVKVYYYDAGGVKVTSDSSDGAFTVTR
jgi:hypothetical protein